jgi:hypothetical protein
MNKLFAVVLLGLTVSVPSFGAAHVVARSAKAASHESYKAAKSSAKQAGKAARAISKLVF